MRSYLPGAPRVKTIKGGSELPQNAEIVVIGGELLEGYCSIAQYWISLLTPAGYFRREPDGGYMFGTATGVIPITPTVLKHLRTLATFASTLESMRRQIPAFCESKVRERDAGA